MKLRDCPYLERLAEATAPKTRPRDAAARQRTLPADDGDDTANVAGREGDSSSTSPGSRRGPEGTARRSR